MSTYDVWTDFTIKCLMESHENFRTFDVESDLILSRLAKTIACLNIFSKYTHKIFYSQLLYVNITYHNYYEHEEGCIVMVYNERPGRHNLLLLCCAMLDLADIGSSVGLCHWLEMKFTTYQVSKCKPSFKRVNLGICQHLFKKAFCFSREISLSLIQSNPIIVIDTWAFRQSW